MKDESANDPRYDATEEERLMALLALTVQELPHGSRAAAAMSAPLEAADVDSFRRLDTDPVALEAYLRKGMRVQQQSQPIAASLWRPLMQELGNFFAPPRVRFATAFGAMLLTGLLVLWQSNTRSMLDAVQQSYAAVPLTMPADALILPWEQRTPVQSFTPTTGNDTLAGIAFAQGLLRGQARVAGNATMQPPRSMRLVENYVALGEWNVLLWAAAESSGDRSADFWRAQLNLARKLGAVFEATDDATVIAMHLTTAETLLVELASAPNPRTARRLASELTRFREAFAPHVSPDSVATPLP
jgi:hypothetical protein